MAFVVLLFALARSGKAAIDESTTSLSSVEHDANARELREMDEYGCTQYWHRRETSFANVRNANLAFWARHPNAPSKHWFDNFEPTYNCDSRERVGGAERFAAFRDGPKFMCGVDFLPKNCLVYNVGSNNNIGFEQALKSAAPWCDIHTFDPMRAMYKGQLVSTFHRIAIAGNAIAERAAVQNSSSLSMTLGEVRRRLGHLGRRIDVLKIDCEGCEWTALLPLFSGMEAGELHVDQLLVEAHLDQSLTYEKLVGWFMSADAAGFRMFSKERNGWGCSGYKCVEFSFVSKVHACREFTATHCPGVSPSAVCSPTQERARS